MENQSINLCVDLFNQMDYLVLAVSKKNKKNIVFTNERFQNCYGNSESRTAEIISLLANSTDSFTHVLRDHSTQKKILWKKYLQETTIVYIAREITEEDRLREENEMLAYILKKVPGYVFWKNLDSVLIGCNENFANQVGLSKPEEIVGMTDQDLPWSVEQTQRFLEDDKQVMISGEPKLEFEEEQTQKNGVKEGAVFP